MDGLFIMKLLAIANRIDNDEGQNIYNELVSYFGFDIVSEAINTMKIVKEIKTIEEK